MLHDTIKTILQRAKELSVKRLDLSNANLSDDHIGELLEYFKQNNYVPRHLDLDSNSIGDRGFVQLIGFQDIEEINLDRNNVTNKGLASLKDKKSSSLKKINLSRNALHSSSGSIIELIRSLCENVYIEISLGNNITIQDRETIKSIQNREEDPPTIDNSMFFSDLQSTTSQVLTISNSEDEETVNRRDIEGFIAIMLELCKTTPDMLYDLVRKNPHAKSLICKTKQELQELGEIKRQVEYNAASTKPQPTYS